MPPSERERRLYEELVRRHSADVYRFAYRLAGDADAADDLVQETFCEAWRSIGSLRDPERAKAWLLQITRHRQARVHRQRARRIQTESVPVSEHAGTGADVLEKLSDQDLLQSALDEVAVRDKEPFLLVFLEEFSCQEAADVLKIPLGTVLSRIHRARQALRRVLRRLDPNLPSMPAEANATGDS